MKISPRANGSSTSPAEYVRAAGDRGTPVTAIEEQQEQRAWESLDILLGSSSSQNRALTSKHQPRRHHLVGSEHESLSRHPSTEAEVDSSAKETPADRAATSLAGSSPLVEVAAGVEGSTRDVPVTLEDDKIRSALIRRHSQDRSAQRRNSMTDKTMLASASLPAGDIVIAEKDRNGVDHMSANVHDQKIERRASVQSQEKLSYRRASTGDTQLLARQGLLAVAAVEKAGGGGTLLRSDTTEIRQHTSMSKSDGQGSPSYRQRHSKGRDLGSEAASTAADQGSKRIGGAGAVQGTGRIYRPK